ncbi:hypothetical protein BGW36DRAFT_327089 [Talaromyces proteolyticus]|uniref:Nuclear pore complex protein Nup85 n=1 Tax=Talaromyces proteolyticus TaxID=1131652 RepID=A0AAD4KHQ0_9EURO|nr:uncharacterized protein BGW36DRAFT_327089 [Talaromyces proteolyticus]KAH8692374.1 hypothetical protein BGW36DRAFT_327089 [Talaromyces proteolyticus]
MAFTVPDSSPPSTPDKSRSLFSNPSTTPAGPPPSSAASFTPHGVPNSSTFGNSQMGSRSNLSFSESGFGQSTNFGGNDSLFSSFSSSKLPPLQNAKSSIFSGSFGNQMGFKPVNASGNLKVRNKRPHNLSQMSAASEDWVDEGEGEEEEEEEEEVEEDEASGEGEDDEEYVDEGDEEGDEVEYEDDEEANFEDDMEMEPTNNKMDASLFGGFNSTFSPLRGQNPAPAPKRIYSNPGNAKRAKIDEQWATSSPASAKAKLIPRKRPSQFPIIARDLAARTKIAAVTEPGEVVLPTDECIGELLDKLQGPEVGGGEAAAMFSEAATTLTDIWTKACKKESEHTGQHQPSGTFGPGEDASGIEKATVVASLLLHLHHPPRKDRTGGYLRTSGIPTNSRSLVVSGSSANKEVPIPKVLVDWLNENHSGSAQEVEALQQTSPNPTASRDFWDIIQAGVLRGRFGDMAHLLREADFNYARSALQDGLSQPGYRGAQLQSIQKVVNKAIQMLESSPLVQENDWDVTGFDWTAYRKRVRSALAELQDYAEGEDPVQPSTGPRFEASNFGMSTNFGASQSGISFTQSLRMAESRVPWSIYQGIKGIYGIIIGESSAIISVSQDWIEATIGLTAWWSGEEDDQSTGLTNMRMSSTVDRSLQETYLRRLNSSFSTVNGDEGAFSPNPLERLDVGVACAFEGNVRGALGILETWSLCLAASVAEIAHEAEWLESNFGGDSLPGLLNENDLMVLSYGQDSGNAEQLEKDDILDDYAHGLSGRDKFQYNGVSRKGWQMALEVLSRMEDTKWSKDRVAELLDQIPVNTIDQVEQMIVMCGDLGFEEQGRKIAANYGDEIMAAAKSNRECDYGLAMICYARARSIRKLRDIVNTLIAYSLQQSRAWPPDEQLGGQLRSLVKNPRVCLSSIAKVDEEAAGILQFYASGYATLRRFYDLRDEPVLSESGKSQLRPLARKRAAAEALVAVIRSAADSIYGGLYDPDQDTAVLVDNLLSLLGEALVFVDNPPSSILSIEQQSTILAAIEDLETVTPRVFTAVQEFFYECLNEYIFEKTGKPSKDSSTLAAGLKKSTSTLTASSSYSMIDREMADSMVTNNTSTTTTSGILIPRPNTMNESAKPIRRGWDWRAGLAASTASSTAGESNNGDGDEKTKPDSKLLWILRLRLAKGMVLR